MEEEEIGSCCHHHSIPTIPQYTSQNEDDDLSALDRFLQCQEDIPLNINALRIQEETTNNINDNNEDSQRMFFKQQIARMKQSQVPHESDSHSFINMIKAKFLSPVSICQFPSVLPFTLALLGHGKGNIGSMD